MASLVASCSRVCGWNNNNSSTTWLPAPDDETTWGNKSNPQSCRCWRWKLFVVWRCLWGRGGALLCKFMSVCLIVCGCMNMYLHNCACVCACAVFLSVWMCVKAVALWLWGTQLGERVSAFILALRGRGPHRYPVWGWKAALQMSPAGVQWPSQQMSCLAAGTLLLSHQLLAEASSKGC